MAAEKERSRTQAWFCTTGLPSDVVVEVGDMTFHLHRFPLVAKSKKLHDLISQQETTTAGLQTPLPDGAGQAPREEDDEDEIRQVSCHISLPAFPGGSDAFEAAAKFCYGVRIDLSPSNVAPLRAAAEFLGMTDDYADDNLVARTEKFLSHSVLKTARDAIRVLESCEPLMPMAEELSIPQRCIDSVVAKASAADPSLFGWPVTDGAAETRASAMQILWNGIDSRRRGGGGRAAGADSWIEDLSLLSFDLFDRLISTMEAHDVSADIVESSVICYAKRHIPGISRSSRKPSPALMFSSVASEAEQRHLLEKLVSKLPIQRRSRPATATVTVTGLLFGLLRTANILNASEACRTALERKIGTQLEQATLDDLLIPSYSYLKETLYDVDCAERILGYFMESARDGRLGVTGDPSGSARARAMMAVAKLIDGYLSEIASDADLKPRKFYELAVALPEEFRLFDDGLYRAVDVFLKAHPSVTAEERENITGVIEYQKLTPEACTHAAQNDRLPLRSIVKVLFIEQLQLRHAIAGTLIAADVSQAESIRSPGIRGDRDEDESAATMTPAGVRHQWRTAARNSRGMRVDMASMRTRVLELERECTNMRKVIEKMDENATAGGGDGGGWKSSLARSFGCKFRTQVQDSQEPAVGEGRRRRRGTHPPRRKQE